MDTLKTDATRKKNVEKTQKIGHKVEDCPNDFECAICSEKHIAGSKDCEVEQKEKIIKEAQNKERVGRRRAIQIMSGEDTAPTTNTKKYATHFSSIMTLEEKKSFTTWSKEKSITQELYRHQT